MRFILRRFFEMEASSGIILLLAAIIAMLIANSPYADLQQQSIHETQFWINDGLMAIFFFVVGLELKRGFIEGPLSNVKQILLPAFAAAGGMLLPALIYIVINYHQPIAIKGWAAPVATDIAFAVAVLSLFGKRVPNGLKLFLLALAIFDDVGAIFIIAVFYTKTVSWLFLSLAVLCFATLYILNRRGVLSRWAYLSVGFLLWLTVLKSGIHPTVAGVLLALMIPHALLQKLEEVLHPWVAYFIMPVFALANAGFSLQSMSGAATSTIVLGIAAGLFLGKQFGIVGMSFLCVRARIAALPAGVTWLPLYGVALVSGIGFTMSLFLGTLAFQGEIGYLSELKLAEVKLGVIIGSLLSGVCGSLVLAAAFARHAKK